jgi:hypothetical protein
VFQGSKIFETTQFQIWRVGVIKEEPKSEPMLETHKRLSDFPFDVFRVIIRS